MSDTATGNQPGGRFATARRGGLSMSDLEFATEKLRKGVSRQNVANMLQCPMSSLDQIDRAGDQATRAVFQLDFSELPSKAARILEQVCEEYQVTPHEIMIENPAAEISRVRQEAYYRLKTMGGYAVFRVAKMMKRDNSTVRSGIKRHELRIAGAA